MIHHSRIVAVPLVLAMSFVVLIAYFTSAANGKTKADPAVVATVDCVQNLPEFVGSRDLRVELADGSTRLVKVQIPTNRDPREPVPMVIAFHGLGGDSKSVLDLMGLTQLAQESEVVLVAPQGRNTEFGKAGWAMESDGFVADAAFLDSVIERVQDLVCIDQHRVFAMGYSNGSVFAQKYACREESPVVAVAGVAGSVAADECGERAMPLIYFHGAADTIVPFDGGDTKIGQIAGVQEALDSRAKINGCETEQNVSGFGSRVARWTWGDCVSGATMRAYITIDGGHHWPGGNHEEVKTVHGFVDQKLNATELSWRFFERAAQASEKAH